MNDFILRPARKTDAAKIRDLIHRVGINPLDLNWEHFVVAETSAGEFIGCAQLKPHRDGSVELASLAVEEFARGQGAARALIERLLEESPRPLFLMCRPELGALYERFGFRPAAEEEMTPYFRRIRRLTRLLGVFGRFEGPLIMRLDRRRSGDVQKSGCGYILDGCSNGKHGGTGPGGKHARTHDR